MQSKAVQNERGGPGVSGPGEPCGGEPRAKTAPNCGKRVWVLQFRASGLVSGLIRWQTRSQVSHSAIVVGELLKDEARTADGLVLNPAIVGGTLYESREGKGVRKQGLCAIQPNSSTWWYAWPETPKGVLEIHWLEVTGQVDTEKLVAFLEAQVGKGYDWTMVARFVTRRQESRPSSGKWFCSELVFAALKEAGLALLRGTEPWEVSPGMLDRSPLLEAKYVSRKGRWEMIGEMPGELKRPLAALRPLTLAVQVGCMGLAGLLQGGCRTSGESRVVIQDSPGARVVISGNSASQEAPKSLAPSVAASQSGDASSVSKAQAGTPSRAPVQQGQPGSEQKQPGAHEGAKGTKEQQQDQGATKGAAASVKTMVGPSQGVPGAAREAKTITEKGAAGVKPAAPIKPPGQASGDAGAPREGAKR